MKLPKSESLILVAFLVCMALWAMSKCSEKRAVAVRQAPALEENSEDGSASSADQEAVLTAPQTPSNQPIPVEQSTPSTAPPVSNTPPTALITPKPGAAPKRPTLTNDIKPPSTAANNANTSSGTTLFVTIDGLNVRKEPGLKGETVATLMLYEPVTFLNKKTDWTQEISLGYEKVTDHWVKIRTKSGKEGWVFGAGLHYYKMKRGGVLENKKPPTPGKKNE